MKSKLKMSGVLFATTLLAAAPLPAATPTAPAPEMKPAAPTGDLFDPVIAKGKGFEIKRSQLDNAVSGLKAEAAARGQEIPPAQLPTMEMQVMNRLIEIQLLIAKATDAEKTKGKEQGDTRFDDIKKRAPSEELLNTELKSVGLNQDQLHSRLIEESTAETVLRGKISITDDQVKAFYGDKTNASKFEEPEKVHVSHILVATMNLATQTELTDDQKKEKMKLADSLLKRARAGEDFAKLVKDFSDDTGSKDKGGEYTFARGDGFVPEFEGAAFSMTNSQISDLVTTKYGYHIIKLIEKTPAHQMELAKVSPDIRDFLEKRALADFMPGYFLQLKKEGSVEIVDDKLKALAAADDAEVTAKLSGTAAPATK